MQASGVSVGDRFVHSLLAKDWTGVETVIDPVVDFRGLTPGSAWQAWLAKASAARASPSASLAAAARMKLSASSVRPEVLESETAVAFIGRPQ